MIFLLTREGAVFLAALFSASVMADQWPEGVTRGNAARPHQPPAWAMRIEPIEPPRRHTDDEMHFVVREKSSFFGSPRIRKERDKTICNYGGKIEWC